VDCRLILVTLFHRILKYAAGFERNFGKREDHVYINNKHK